MNLRTLEQQLKNQSWTNNFQDTKLVKRLYDQTAEAVGSDEKVFSLTCAQKIGTNGELIPGQWLLIATQKELIFLELDQDEDFWHSSPQRLNLLQINSIEGVASHLNPKALRLSIIGNEKGFVFESIDLDSANHLLNKTQAILKGEIDMDTKTVNSTRTNDSKEWETIEKVSTDDKQDHGGKGHGRWRSFFNSPNPFRSQPIMEIMSLICLLAWIICDSVFIGLTDALNLSRSAEIGLGVVMLFFSLLALVILVFYLIQIWNKALLTNEVKIVILLEGLILLLMIISILILAQKMSGFIFAVVGVFVWLGLTTWITLSLTQKLLAMRTAAN
jgi:hypothetical protein